jgi:hypothetical protein
MELTCVVYFNPLIQVYFNLMRVLPHSPAGANIFPLSSVSRPALEPTQPPVQWVPGVRSPGVKTRSGRDADHSPPSSAEVENV